MYGPFQLALRYLRYQLKASNGKGHGIHSPFVYGFIRDVLNDRHHYYTYDRVEALRQRSLSDETVLEVEDMGAGSVVSKTKQRKVKAIAASALKPKKFGQLLFRIVDHYGPLRIVELGTSLGITTAYMALANSKAQVITMEGADAIADQAMRHFEELGIDNITLVRGNFDATLPLQMARSGTIDLAFVDGNHRKEPTLRYFEQLMQHIHEGSILIFDDIHWSKEMEEAWQAIQADDRVLLTIDLFFIGLVFFRKDFKAKQHFTIRF